MAAAWIALWRRVDLLLIVAVRAALSLMLVSGGGIWPVNLFACRYLLALSTA